ncbi:MAG: MlaD family protein [Myxococcota bacterium]
MTDDECQEGHLEPDLPRPVDKKRKKKRLTISWSAWIVPAIALVVAMILVGRELAKDGPEIILQFEDGTGLQAGKTLVAFRGVKVGQVEKVELSSDLKHVEVTAQLDRSARKVAVQDSMFWIVRPEIGLDRVKGSRPWP